MTQDSDRILFLDRWRGLAVMGILLVNSIAFAQPFDVYSNPALSPLPLSDGDKLTWWVTEVFFKEKFVTTFTMLFGISLFLVGCTQSAAEPAYRTPLFRRLSWLVVFGIIHGALIWHGDILLAYAVTGFFFWRWREASAAKLLAWGLVLWLGGLALLIGQSVFDQLRHADLVQVTGDIPAYIAQMRQGYWAATAQNFTVWSTSAVAEVIGYLPVTLGLMMVGLGLFKSGVLSGEAPARLYWLMLILAAPCLVAIGVQSQLILAQGFPFPATFGTYAIANQLLCLPVALGYASALILAGRTRVGAVLLHPLACAGRMAFTNYLSQSLIMTAIFYGGHGNFLGAGLFGTMNHSGLVPIVASIWAAQLVISPLWLAVFRYGPFEWVWRCLTYNRLMPLIR